jgi:hypothetical protein
MMPVMPRNVLESARLLADKVVAGAEPDVEGNREYPESSPRSTATWATRRLRPSPSGRLMSARPSARWCWNVAK